MQIVVVFVDVPVALTRRLEERSLDLSRCVEARAEPYAVAQFFAQRGAGLYSRDTCEHFGARGFHGRARAVDGNALGAVSHSHGAILQLEHAGVRFRMGAAVVLGRIREQNRASIGARLLGVLGDTTLVGGTSASVVLFGVLFAQPANRSSTSASLPIGQGYHGSPLTIQGHDAALRGTESGTSGSD